MRSRDTRLAVMFATAPASNVMRAFAMSTNGVNTGTPTAETDATPPPTNVRTRSMSWIIRSSTTATSEPRGLNGASRSLSMNRGASTNGSAARTARLNRSTCPVCSTAPVRRAIASSSSASSSVVAIGFSISTCSPRSSAGAATAKCARRRHDDAHRVDGIEQRSSVANDFTPSSARDRRRARRAFAS